MNFEDIVRKYNYSRELAEFLKQIYDELVIYFGKDKEPIVFEALLNTEIVDTDNIYDYLTREFDFKEDGVNMSSCSLNKASGICYSNSSIDYDESSDTYKLVGVNRKVLVCNLSSDEDNVKGSFIHELGHLIKDYYKGHEIKGNLLIVRSGFKETIYKLSYEDGKVKETFMQENGWGLEEGLNSILEHSIAKRIVNPNYYVSGYDVVRELANILFQQLGLKDVILNAQVMKEKESFVNEFDSMFMNGAFMRFESILDKIYELGLKQVSNFTNSQIVSEMKDKIDDLIMNDLSNLLTEMKEARNAKRSVA